MLGMYSKRTNTPEDTTLEKRCKSVFGGGLADSTDTEGGASDNHGPVDMQTGTKSNEDLLSHLCKTPRGRLLDITYPLRPQCCVK